MKLNLAILTIILIGVAAAAYYARDWRSGYEILKITIEGNQTVSRDEILSAARIKDSAVIETDAEIELIRDRLLNHPEIKKAYVSKNPPYELKIEIVEKRPAALINAGNELLLVDDEMETFPYRQSAKALDLPVISGLRTENAHNPKNRFSKEDLRYALFILSSAYKDSKLLYGQISEINMADSSMAVIYLSEDSCPVYFPRIAGRSIGEQNYRDELLNKLTILENYLKQSLDEHLASEVNYVDLRYTNHVIVNSNH